MSPAHAKPLRAALLFFAASHAAGLATMALLLRPGMDPSAFSVAERAAYVASHETEWWLGWLPWRLAAASNFGVGIALVCAAKGSSRAAARLALFWLCVAAAPEQWAEWRLVTSFVADAKGNLTNRTRGWTLYAAITGVWANFGYTISVGYWMRAAALLQRRAVLAPWLERALLASFALSGMLTLAAARVSEANAGVWFTASSAVNGLAFPALIVWSLVWWRRLGSA